MNYTDKFLINKTYNNSQLKELSFNIRNEIIENVSKFGGHLSSNLGNVESVVALHYCFDFPKDKLIFDVGHQCYAHKLLSGRSLENLRQDNGISGFQETTESEFDPVDSGHSSTSIGQALGLALLRKQNNKKHQIIAYIGDGSFANGLVYEALNVAIQLKQKIIIVLNDNNMAITKTAENLGTFLNSKLAREIDAFELIDNVDGHNFEDLISAFNKAKNYQKTTIVKIKTIKGYGLKLAQEDKIGYYHKVNPANLNEKIDFTPNKKLLCTIAANYLSENIENDAIVINAATAISSSLLELSNKIGDKFIDVGMGEEIAALLAATYGLEKHSYFFVNSSFAQRCYDQILHDIARKNSHCTILIDKVGLMGGDGETHQGIYDLSFLNSIPNIKIFTPSNEADLIEILEYSKKNKETLVIRLPAEPLSNYQINRTFALKENEMILTYGNQFNELKRAIEGNIYECKYQKPFILNNLKISKKIDTIFVYDTYSTSTGFFNIVLNNLNKNIKVVNISLPDSFIRFGSISSQKKLTKTTIDDLIKIIKETRYANN